MWMLTFTEDAERQPIHKKAPTFDGVPHLKFWKRIKVIGLPCYLKGGKVGLFGGARLVKLS